MGDSGRVCTRPMVSERAQSATTASVSRIATTKNGDHCWKHCEQQETYPSILFKQSLTEVMDLVKEYVKQSSMWSNYQSRTTIQATALTNTIRYNKIECYEDSLSSMWDSIASIYTTIILKRYLNIFYKLDCWKPTHFAKATCKGLKLVTFTSLHFLFKIKVRLIRQNSSFFYPDYSAQFLDSMNESRKSSWTQQTESLRFV